MIATGLVERQLQAMASHLEDALEKAGLKLRRDAIQGSPDWVLIDAGDLVILISYGLMDESDAKSYIPRVVHVDGDNRVVELGADPSAPVPGAVDQQRSDHGVPVR